MFRVRGLGQHGAIEAYRWVTIRQASMHDSRQGYLHDGLGGVKTLGLLSRA